MSVVRSVTNRGVCTITLCDEANRNALLSPVRGGIV